MFFSETPRFPGNGLGEGRKGKEYRGPGHKFTEANGSAFFLFQYLSFWNFFFFFAFEAVVLRAIN